MAMKKGTAKKVVIKKETVKKDPKKSASGKKPRQQSKPENKKIPISNFPGVSYTALMTIYCRAMDYLSKDSILKDKYSHDFFERIECDWKTVKRGLFEHDFKLTAIRGRKFDRMCMDFLSKNPDGIVVSLGSGLDYRFGRIDNGKCLLVDIDLPEVILLKKDLCPESARNLLLGQSVMDFSWIEKIIKLSKKGKLKVFFIAEGLIPYFEKSEIRELFEKISRNFPGSEIFFDVCNTKGYKFMSFHSGIKKWNTDIKCGYSSGREIEDWNTGFRVLGEWLYPDDPDAHKGLSLKLMWLVPMFRSMLFFIHGKFEG